MAKLAYGSPDKHVLKSQGADTDLLKFYCTQNSTTYGAKWAKFEPRTGHPSGSGYVSNVRPVIAYNSRIDEIDNPAMGHIVAGNYHTITERSFGRYTGPTGAEPLPNSVYHAGSGFVRGKQTTIPTHQEARNVCIGATISSAPAVDILPRHKPILHSIQRKDPVELENGGYGPGCMTTETSERFQARSSHFDSSQKTIGNLEDTGFTHNHHVEPITYHPDYAYHGDVPGFLTPRPTGISITTTDFRPSVGGTGKETLPRIANRSSHDSGFTVGTKVKTSFIPTSMRDAYGKIDQQTQMQVDQVRKQDPMEFLNLTHPNNQSSVAQNTWLGKQRNESSEAERLGNSSIGRKESTGFSTNNYINARSADPPGRFITDYQTRFWDKTPQGVDREGHVWGGVQNQKENGYTKNTHTNSFGSQVSSSDTLRRLEPYVARSIKVRDVFYDDHTYDSKVAVTALM